MERVVLVWARPCQVLGTGTAAAGVLILDLERGSGPVREAFVERFVDLRDEEWATQKRKSVSSIGIRVSNGLEMGECRIALGLSLGRACLRHSLMYSGKARDAHQGCPSGIWKGWESAGRGAEACSLGQAGLRSS